MARLKKRKLKYRTARSLFGVLYVLPFLIGFLMFFAVPLVNTIIYSFSNVGVSDQGGMTLSFTGFTNYINLFTTEVSTTSATIARVLTEENSTILTNAPIIIVFSLFLALLANRKFKGRAAVRVIFFLPIVLGLEIVMQMMTENTGGDLVATRGNGIFSQGIANYLLMRYTDLSVSVIDTVTSFVDNIFELISQAGVQTLIYLAGLQSISPSLYEVAKIEGATGYETFWKVTFPSIANITFFVAIYTLVDLFLRSSIAEEVYNFAFIKSKIGVGSALSVVYMLNVLIMLLILLLLLRRMVKKNES
ncbi:MAG: sugar ABC transporter permease [Lachnospiraceae bacterium]|nr:sugar ABC transporter permease [Lachnospiraceae bacterium]